MALEQMEGFELAGRTVRFASFYGLPSLLIDYGFLAACQHGPREGDNQVHPTGLVG